MFALLLGLAGQTADPLAPAAEGKLQCYSPNVANRTCQSLAAYKPDGTGGFLNTAEVLVAPALQITMETVTPVRIKDGAVCGAIRKIDIDRAVLRRDGVTLSPEAARPLIDKFSQSLAPIFDREICTSYVTSGDTLRAQATLDGVADQTPPQTVIWIPSDAGYRVAR